MLYIALYVHFANPTVGGGTSTRDIVGIIWIYGYAFGWSFDHPVAPYVTAAELLHPRTRSISMCECLSTNWLVNYGITYATPRMIRTHAYPTEDERILQDVQDPMAQDSKLQNPDNNIKTPITVAHTERVVYMDDHVEVVH
ncbi:uncharacterized protein BCR38DRAFT_506284 [Pseudomassariella vexata]|uniref:Uncharacterized protein n=1 Tax=Pseudomassariella vexata TaxID=1141098 RepID=A0A1Y2D9F2_9PEZI|nr:uncharacterized protein BCR38DRAFT_506284 [Pseudomassariella vexata]ORY55275.1 hypothetical protein BCR38DRAFT_506284 [Pseudomassariella vexata]